MSKPSFILFLFLLSSFLPLLICVHAQSTLLPQYNHLPPLDKSTLYPKLCRSILSAFRFSPSPSNPDDFGKFSVKQSLKHAQKLSQLIKYYLNKPKLIHRAERNALADCGQLYDLTVEYLESISSELKSAKLMTDELVEKVETLLSAVVTNQDTCYDALVDSGSTIASVLREPLSNATVLYSVSLGLVRHAIGKVRRSRHHKGGGVAGKQFQTDVASSILKKAFIARSNGSKRGGRNLVEEMDSGAGVVVNNAVTVSPYGGENFTTIGNAIEFAPNNSNPEDGYFIIYAMEGCYEEYILVPQYKKNIMLIGDGINRTVITGNRSVVDGWTTFNSATFAVSGERFVAMDITFKNTAGPQKHQAVAVRNNADLSTFYRCSFEGYQDTLYVHSLRQFYRDCHIYGTVDFIFGNSASVFQNCNIFARKPMPNQKNVVTAQGRTDPNQNTGISIHNCTIRAAPDLAMDINSTTLNYLGRPWKEYSRTVYMESYIGELINPIGWLEWNGTVGLDTLYYGEYENYGPGANTSRRVKWPGYGLMNASQAWNFTVFNLTLGDTWLPYTTIPFVEGLLNEKY